MHDCNRIFDRIATAVSETLWPTRCIGCDLPGTLLCARCRERLPYIDARAACPRCGAPYGMTDCTECARNIAHGEEEGARAPERPEFPFAAARAALSYEGIAKRLVGAYKDHDERRLAPVLATLVCQAMRGTARGTVALPAVQERARPADWTAWADALVAVPASAEALRRRGFDHMGLVARFCAEYAGLPLLDALAQTRRAADQRGLGAGDRARNREGSFVLAPDAPRPLPARIVLVDDVLTTGATASAAAEALLAGGARSVAVAVAARVW